jgi:hypothetical protein
MPMVHGPAQRGRNACGVGNTWGRGLLAHNPCLDHPYADVLVEQQACNKLRLCQQSVRTTPKWSSLRSTRWIRFPTQWCRVGDCCPAQGAHSLVHAEPLRPRSAPTLTAFHRDDSLEQAYSDTGIRTGRWASDDHKTTRQKLSQFTRCGYSTRAAQRPCRTKYVRQEQPDRLL